MDNGADGTSESLPMTGSNVNISVSGTRVPETQQSGEGGWSEALSKSQIKRRKKQQKKMEERKATMQNT